MRELGIYNIYFLNVRFFGIYLIFLILRRGRFVKMRKVFSVF